MGQSDLHAILLPGIYNTDGGDSTIGKLQPALSAAGVSSEILDYGFFGIFAPRWRNDNVAEELNARVSQLQDEGKRVMVMAHSNGCAITHLAGKNHDMNLELVVYMAAALNKGVEFPSGFKQFHVWHNPKDIWPRIARFLPFHTWGEMGSMGFTQHDTRGKNFNALTNFPASAGRRHSYFGAGWPDLIVDKALEAVSL